MPVGREGVFLLRSQYLHTQVVQRALSRGPRTPSYGAHAATAHCVEVLAHLRVVLVHFEAASSHSGSCTLGCGTLRETGSPARALGYRDGLWLFSKMLMFGG